MAPRNGNSIVKHGVLDERLNVHGVLPVFNGHKVLFGQADAVFAGATALQGNGPLGQAMGDGFGPFDFVGVVRVDQDHGMEVTIADMAENRCEKAVLRQIRRRGFNAFGQPRNRHHGIGGQGAATGAQGEGSEVAVMPGLPQTAAILRMHRPFEVHALMFIGDHAHGLDLFFHAGFRSMQFKKQGRRLAQLRAAVGVEGAQVFRWL